MKLPYRLEVIWCRTFQTVLKIGNYFMGYRMPTYLEGPGKIQELGAFLKEKKINDVLVVTGSGMVRRGQVEPMLAGFRNNGVCFTVQTFDHPDPTSDDVELGYRVYRENGCKAIVAIGGGSRIDCAKAIAAKAVHPRKKVSKLQGLLKVHWPIPPFVAIPTTAGAGSETTVAAVITDSATHRKAAINDPFLIPKYAVLDPELTAVLLPHVMREFGASAHARLAELADVCGIGGANEAEKANGFIRWIEETNAQMGLPDGFDVIRDEDIDQMIAWARREANPLYPVPVVWVDKDFRRLIQRIRK